MPILHRRQFVRAGSLAAASLLLPKFLRASGEKTPPREGKILVVVELSGGNDGLNTVIPYRDDIYHKTRPGLSISRQQALALTDDLGLHPALKGLKSLYDDGSLGVLNSVGYARPSRCHSRAMAIWQTAGNSENIPATGWIGRYLDVLCDGYGDTSKGVEIDNTPSLLMKGAFRRGLAASRYVTGQSNIRPSATSYPDSVFGKGMKTIAELIISGNDARAYHISLGGFDTHANQPPRQEGLFTQLGKSLEAFAGDLKRNDRFKDVLAMTFSEFGRKVAGNAGGGTDHGTANCMFILSGGLRKQGILSPAPDLSHFDENDPESGDLIPRLDFRDVYATVLRHWLQTDDKRILGEDRRRLDFI